MEEYEEDTNEDIKWRTLGPKDRVKFLKNLFSDEDWYDGTPFFQGGDTNPDFQTICDRSGAPMAEVKRYYASWLDRQGFDPKRANQLEKDKSSMVAPQTAQQTFNSTAAPSPAMPTMPMDNAPDPMDQMMMSQMQQKSQGDSGASNMMFMMHFLTSQQKMQMQQQQFQAQMMMQQELQRQQTASEMRREQMARDQQFMNQQTTLLRESFKRANDGGFQGKMQQALEEKMIDELVHGKDSNWKDDVKDVLGSETLKDAVSGLGGALMARGGGMAAQPQVPVGYDMPDYNPYAQPVSPQPLQQQPVQPQIQQPQIQQQQIQQQHAERFVQQEQFQQQQQMDGVFFEEQQAQPLPSAQTPEVATQPQIQTMNKDEYNQILFQSFSELLGPAMQDPQVAKAVQEQIEVAVDVTMIEMPQALPQVQLQAMSEKMLLVRNLRDICFGLRDLRDRTTLGQAPNAIVMAAVVSELKKRPEFYNIFATNTYEELIAQLEPFKDTGAIKFDYEYLLKPEIAEIARSLLGAVAADAQQ